MKKVLLGFALGVFSLYASINGLLLYTTGNIEQCMTTFAKEFNEAQQAGEDPTPAIERAGACLEEAKAPEKTMNYFLLYPIHKIKGR